MAEENEDNKWAMLSPIFQVSMKSKNEIHRVKKKKRKEKLCALKTVQW